MIARLKDREFGRTADRFIVQRRVVETACPECLVDIHADHDSKWGGTVSVALLGVHAGAYITSWKGRLRYAWRILRGRIWADIELADRHEVDDLINALIEARDHAFPGASKPALDETYATDGLGRQFVLGRVGTNDTQGNLITGP